MRFHCFSWEIGYSCSSFFLCSLSSSLSLCVCICVRASLSIFHFNPFYNFQIFRCLFITIQEIFPLLCCRCCCFGSGGGGGCTDQTDDTFVDMISIKLNDVDVDDFIIYCSIVYYIKLSLIKHCFLLVDCAAFRTKMTAHPKYIPSDQ